MARSRESVRTCGAVPPRALAPAVTLVITRRSWPYWPYFGSTPCRKASVEPSGLHVSFCWFGAWIRNSLVGCVDGVCADAGGGDGSAGLTADGPAVGGMLVDGGMGGEYQVFAAGADGMSN